LEEIIVSVHELNDVINRIFKSEEMLHGVCVAGEISGISVSGPHAYFTLKDELAQLNCCCFSYKKTYFPKNGEAVIARGSPDYWVKGGRLSFNVDSIRPSGEGLLYRRIEELKAKLKAAGVFDEDKKIPVPQFADNICVVTSKTGAVIRDIVKTVRKKNKSLNITVCDVRVQGERAAEDIARALKNVDKAGFDVVIIARGGGSLEDLMPFYSEEVALAVYAMKTPVISAVGHETDFSICDMAADLRMPTPTAAAEYAAFDEDALKAEILSGLLRAKRLIRNNFEYKRSRLISAVRAVVAAANAGVSERLAYLKSLNFRMSSAAAAVLAKKKGDAERALVALEKAGPIGRLKSGYFKLEKDGETVPEIAGLKLGDDVKIYGIDGAARASVTDVFLN
jgi:exodeoxyribonuclease VII large subunit